MTASGRESAANRTNQYVINCGYLYKIASIAFMDERKWSSYLGRMADGYYSFILSLRYLKDRFAADLVQPIIYNKDTVYLCNQFGTIRLVSAQFGTVK